MFFLTDRKLFAYGFLSDLIPWCFIPIGNYSRIVSYSAWLHCISYRQETIRERFPVRLGSMLLLAHRKLFAGRFLDSARNDKRAWLYGVSCPQETVREGFPVRLGSMVFLTHRKLLAKGFLSGLAPWCFLPTGNCSPGDFSTPLEMTKGRGSMAFLAHRKLLAKGFLSGLAPWCCLPRGNCSPGDFSTPLEMTKGRGSTVLLTYSKLFTPPLTPVNCPLAAAALFLYT